MGKRELLIALAFVIIGVAAYQFTAPAPREGEQGFSFSRMFSGLRREISSNSASATHTIPGTLAVSKAVTEVRFTTGRSGMLTVVGEDREDLAYEMQVRSTGPDQPTALGYAKRVALKPDDLGSVMTLGVSFPEEGSQSVNMTVRLPRRLAVRLDGTGRANVSAVTAVHLGNSTGETSVSDVAGAVTGSHRTGDLTISESASVNLTLRSSRARLSGIRNGVTITSASGECHVRDSKGNLEVTATGSETTITGHTGRIRIGGEGGEVRITNPTQETTVDMRRADLDVTLDAPVALTLLTSDEPLRLTLDGPPAIVIDAMASDGGTILATDFSLTATPDGTGARLAHTFASATTRVVMRNPRGEIVIMKRK